MTESENPFRRPSRGGNDPAPARPAGPEPAADRPPGPEPAADRPAGPDPQGAPPHASPPADAEAPSSGPSRERHPPGSDAANDLWDTLGAAVTPPRSSDVAEEAESESPGLPGDSLGAPPPEESSSATDPVAEAESFILEDLSRLAAERDDYLAQLQRLTADFDNYRKRILKQQSDQAARAAEGLVEKLLEVLDTFDMALAHGEGFDQVHGALFSVLEKEGLERVDPTGKPFDPNEADAVAHEDGDGGPVVADVLRPGYRWKGRVLRPAMVKVRG